MKKIPFGQARLLFALLFAGLFFHSAAQNKKSYTPDWESVGRHTPVPEWIRDAKFGIYCHWGVYSVPAYDNEQYYYYMHQDSSYDKMGTWRRQEALYGPLSKFGYHDFIPMFKAEKFDANEWAQLFKESGARFAGTVAEHHDGFAMWDSKYTPFNAKAMGPKRDVIGELATAIKARDMKFFASLHHPTNYTYLKVKPHWAAADPKYKKMYGSQMKHEEWLQMWQDKSNEVVNKYHPDIMYFDIGLDQIPDPYKLNYIANYFNEGRKHNQEVIITYKNKELPTNVGMLDHENSNPAQIEPTPWLCDYAIGTGYHYSWGYVKGMQIKTAKDIIHKLIEVVSNNGQMLLNLSPMADGSFPQDQKDVVANVGVWLWSYGEAVYDTRPYLAATETTVQGYRVYYTKKNKSLYAIFLDWPRNGEYIQLKKLGLADTKSAVKSVTVLGLKESAACSFTQTNEQLLITIPHKTRIPSDIAQVLKIELE